MVSSLSFTSVVRSAEINNSSILSSNVNKSKHTTTKSTPFGCIDTFAEIMGHQEFAQPSGDKEGSRKRRLDHLSLDEKIKRKKLKNRVAAQTSRDRKKARMDELEAEIGKLKARNHQLTSANRNLQLEKAELSKENLSLRLKACECQPRVVGCSPLNSGPAVPKVYPLLKESGLQPASGLKHHSISATRILTFYTMLSEISRQTSKTRSGRSKNSLIVSCEKLAKMNQDDVHRWISRWVRETSAAMKWWGRHQNTWNPVES